MSQLKLNESTLLSLYDQAERLPPIRKAHAVLAAVNPALSEDIFLDLAIGERDRQLWSLRKAVFRQPIKSTFQCAHCEEWLDFGLAPDFDLPEAKADPPKVQYQGETYQLRLPTSRDQLLARNGGFPVNNLNMDAPWSNPEFKALAIDVLDEADPGLDITFDVKCEACKGSNLRALDVLEFVWADIQGAAQSILAEIASLARLFGWTETDCLALSARRRAAYIELMS